MNSSTKGHVFVLCRFNMLYSYIEILLFPLHALEERNYRLHGIFILNAVRFLLSNRDKLHKLA